MKGAYNYKMFGFSRKFKNQGAEPPSDVKEAFARFTNGGDSMSADQLLRFIVEYQRQSECTMAGARSIIEQVLQKPMKPGQSLSLEEFICFLFNEDLNGPIKSQVHHDMNAPLSHYFIHTGHNSYLTGNQLSSDCSDAPIIKSLQRGVRVIELDLWPNSSKDDVHVLHGRTLTSPVSLIRCLRSIKDHAFEFSPYPVIITFEDHLTPDLQAKVKEMVTTTFGNMLYYPQTDGASEFPSPEHLKNRIIISTKPPKEDQENDDKSFESDQEEEEDMYQRSSQQGPLEYKHLISIHAGKPKGSLRDALKVEADKVRRLSLSEQQLEKAAASHGQDIVRFTHRNILRIYPKGTRFNSSNYDPHVGWMHGAQMVAFNMQGYGKHLWVMSGMFKANGGCGYLKKPNFLLTGGPNGEVFDPKRTMTVKRNLKVDVYMGDGWNKDFSLTHFDTFSPPDFYTKVYVVGVPSDSTKKRTKTIEDSWVPVWNEEFIFPLTVPELAVLRIEVRDYDKTEKDDFAGRTCLPVVELRPGIRSVPLYNNKGEKFKHVKLLMGFQFV